MGEWGMSDKYQKNIDASPADKAKDAAVLYKSVPSYTIGTITSNFQFLKQHDPIFYQLAFVAEQFFTVDPNTTMMKLRHLAEVLAKDMASRFNIPSYSYKNQHDLIYQIDRKINLDSRVKDIFHKLRKNGNKPVHKTQEDDLRKIDLNSINMVLRTEGSYNYVRIGN